jgi:paraquat-inducible protein B
MSDKSQPIAIGAFVIGASLIAITTVLFLLGSGFGEKEKIVMVFDGSVKGLNVGAPLALRGVTIGEVTDVDLILNGDTGSVIIVVEADLKGKNIRRTGDKDFDPTEELIARGLRAQLTSQSLLTGLLYVELDFHPGSPLNLADIESTAIQIPTIPTTFERFTKKLQEIDIQKMAEQIDSIAESINHLVTSEEFQNLPVNATDTLDSLQDLSSQFQDQLASTGPKIDTVLDEAAETVASANSELPRLTTLIEENLKVLEGAITAFEKGMTGIDGLVSPDSVTLYQLNNALKEITRAGRSLQSLATTLEEQPESIIKGKSGDQ